MRRRERKKGMTLKRFMIEYDVRGLDGPTIREMQEHQDDAVIIFFVGKSRFMPQIWAVLFTDGREAYGVIEGFRRSAQATVQFIESWKMKREVLDARALERLRFSWEV